MQQGIWCCDKIREKTIQAGVLFAFAIRVCEHLEFILFFSPLPLDKQRLPVEFNRSSYTSTVTANMRCKYIVYNTECSKGTREVDTFCFVQSVACNLYFFSLFFLGRFFFVFSWVLYIRENGIMSSNCHEPHVSYIYYIYTYIKSK